MKANRITPVVFLCIGLVALLIAMIETPASRASGSGQPLMQGPADSTATSTSTPASLMLLPLVVHSEAPAATPTPTSSLTPTATATATSTATSTPTATATAACTDPIYVTNFGTQDGRWPTGEDSGRAYGYQSGEYRMYLKTSNASFMATPGLVLPEDYRISVNARQAAGSGGAYGVVFGVRTVGSEQEYYRFAVRPDAGQYSLERVDLSGTGTTLITWTSNAAILSGAQVNNLRVDRIGSEIELFTNGALLQAFTDVSFTGVGRDSGIWARSYDSGSVDMRFDLFRVGCGSDTLFFDGFADTGSGWGAGSNASAAWGYSEGEYQMVFSAADYGLGKTPYLLLPANYSIEADVRQTSGNSVLLGLDFDMIWSGAKYTAYEFLLDPASGYYLLQKGDLAGTWTTLIDWTPESGIKPGIGTNRLRVDRIGAEIWLYINGTNVDYYEDGDFAGVGRDAGLRAYSETAVPAEARFDNFRVTILP
jgi:hypothetical protein